LLFETFCFLAVVNKEWEYIGQSLHDSPVPGSVEGVSYIITCSATIHIMVSGSKVKQIGWNKIVHSQTKEVIYNVYKFMKWECKTELLKQ
jgi:hypothetical protein